MKSYKINGCISVTIILVILLFIEAWIILDEDLFPEVQWSDEEPTKVKLIINK